MIIIIIRKVIDNKGLPVIAAGDLDQLPPIEGKPGYLDNIKGTYITPKGYFVSEEKTNIFDQKFI